MKWNVLNHYKNDNGRNFQYAKFSAIDLVLTDRRNLSGTQPKSSYGKSSSFRFSFSAARNDINKAPQYVTLGFSFRIWFSSPSTKHNLKNNHRLRMVKTLPFTHQPVRVARKASECQQLTGDMKQTWKISHFFFPGALLQLFLGLQIFV